MPLNRCLMLFSFIYILIESSSQSIDQNKGYLLIPNEWEVIKDGWPKQDIEDSFSDKNSKFFYTKVDLKNPMLKFKIQQKFIEEVKKKSSNYFKITFKVWYNNYEPSFEFVAVKCDIIGQRISDEYNKLYKNLWMPFQCVLPEDYLSNFEITALFGNENTILAFKDFKIEYEMEYTQNYEQIKNIGSAENEVWKNDIIPSNWNFYIPPKEDAVSDFFFFTNNCVEECQINNTYYRLPKDKTENNITEVHVQFDYYTIGSKDTSIQLSNMIQSTENTNKWTTCKDITIKDKNDFNKISIKVKINKVGEFVAIKNLKVTLKMDGGPDLTDTCDKKETCKWLGLEEASWSKTNKFVKQEKDKNYLYPISNKNELTIRRSDELDVYDVCFNLAYRVANNKNSNIKIYYQNSNEKRSHMIMNIKPKVFDIPEFDEFTFCMRDIIALNSKNYLINIVVEQSNFQKGVDDFILGLKTTTNNQTKTKAEFDNSTRTFIRGFTKDTKLNEEWMQLIPSKEEIFDLTDGDAIHFNAKPDSFIPASAMLLSKYWIRNSPSLFSNRGKYTLYIPDVYNVIRFNIRPKICDWLFQCFDVNQRLENDKDNVRTYSFDYPRKTDSTHLKLLFYVEYFNIEYYTQEQNNNWIKFDLKLEHLGDPCYESKCANSHECSSDPNHDLPNIPKCEEKNNCRKVENITTHINISGEHFCNEFSKPDKLGCENFDDTFRCICQGDTLNWNQTSKECEKPEVLHNNTWKYINSISYCPSQKNNHLEFKFININYKKLDICFSMKATIKESVTLIFYYSNQTNDNLSNKRTELYRLKLSKDDNLNIDFCLSDFLLNFSDKFSIIFEVNATNYDQTPFTTTIETNSKDLDKIPQFIRNTNNKDIDKDKKGLRIIPDTLKMNDSFIIKLKDGLSANETYTGHIVSAWIEPKQTFNNSENFFQINIKEENFESFSVKPRIIFADDELNHDLQPISKSGIFRIIGLQDIKKIFKIILEINFKTKINKTISNLDLLISSISIGDPCQKFNDSSNQIYPLCGQKCEAISATKHKCNCTTGYGAKCVPEDQCTKKVNEIDNFEKDKCQKFPSVPFGGICETLDINLTQCTCNKDYNSKDYICPENKKFLNQTSKVCIGGDCDILYTIADNKQEKIETQMLWYNKNLPDINYNETFYRPKNNSSLEIKVKELDQTSDACLSISYIISENAKLSLNINNVKRIEFGSSKRSNSALYSKQYKQETENICLRKTFGKIEGEFNLSLSPQINKENDFFMVLKFNEMKLIHNYTIYSDLLNELSYLSYLKNDDDKNFNYDNQWPIQLPTTESYWTKKDNELTFSVSEDVPHIKTSYIISQLLRKEVSNKEFKFKIDNPDFTNYLICVVVFDEKMQEFEIKDTLIGDKDINKNATDENVNNGYAFSIPEMKTSFRIGIKAYYRTTKENNAIKFTIKNFFIGDPCVDPKLLEPIKCGDHGNCTRKDMSDFFCKCEPNYSYLDHTCVEDKCNIFSSDVKEFGKDFCKNKVKNATGCEVDNSKLGFRCECDNGTNWIINETDYTKSECRRDSQCLLNKCKQTEKCKETDENYICICNNEKDYYNTTVGGKCEKYDPCSKRLRGFKDETKKDKEPCGDPKLKCLAFGLGKDDYICVCPDGFINTDVTHNYREDSNCAPIACSFPSLNPCKQMCVSSNQNEKNYTCGCYNPDIYQINGNDCKKISDKCNCENGAFCKVMNDDADKNDLCVCKEGYDPVKDSKGKTICKPKTTIEPVPLVCPSKNMTIYNDELACLCGENYSLNDKKTCDLKPICGKNGRGRIDCDKKDALCVSSIHDDGTIDYNCLCTSDKQFNDTDIETTRSCIDKCKFDDRDIKCLNLNAICDPTLITENDFKKSKLLKEETYCLCRPGFVKEGGKCLMATYAKQINISVKLDPTESTHSSPKSNLINFNKLKPFDLEKYTNDLISENNINLELYNNSSNFLKKYYISKSLKDTITSIFIKIMKDTNVKFTISLEKCDPNSNNFYDCTIVLTTANLKDHNKFGDIKGLFQKKCRTLSYNQKLCYFDVMATSLYYAQVPTSILIDYEKWNQSNPIMFNPCKSTDDSQVCPDYSRCETDTVANTSRFSCLCNEEDFTVSGSKVIEVQTPDTSDKIFKKQTCRVRDDLCKRYCGKKNETCIQTAPVFSMSSNKWTAEPKCSCAKNFTYTKNGNTTECTDVCTIQKCYHGTCKPTGDSGATCLCNEGWYGEECDSEKKASLGGWIAGIVILAVLVVVASGIAMYFARKSRNSPANHSGHTLDEYSGSSYRVGQTGQPRGQPAYSNPAFHRE